MECGGRQFYTTARCCPSRASLLSGQYPHRVGVGHMVTDLGQPGYRGRLSENAATIAEVLRPAGYRTFISGKWHVGTNDPTQHGFEQFYGTLISASTFWDPAQYLRLPRGSRTRAYEKDAFYGTDALTDYALDFLEDARRTPDQPWFLYLAYNSPHFPLHARRAGDREIPGAVRRRMGLGSGGASGENEEAGAGGRKDQADAALAVLRTSARPGRARIRRGAVFRRSGGRTWRGGWRSTPRWSTGWIRISDASRRTCDRRGSSTTR